VPEIIIPYTPRPLQRVIHDSLKRFNVVICHRRFGKCLDVDTPIPTPSGFKPMGELVDGDEVFSVDGSVTKVKHAHPVLYNLNCYEVVFSDGSKVICDEDHLWYTETKADRTHTVGRGKNRKHSPRKGSEKKTKDILKTLKSRGENNHAVPVCDPVQYPERDFIIDPYILGAWIGDGHSYNGCFTTMDNEILQSFKKFYAVNETKYQRSGKAKTYQTHGLCGQLNMLGVLKNKHIPVEYLMGSIEQRKQILAGLMDTDGTISRKSNSCEIVQKRKQVADSIKILLSSLGVVYSEYKKIVDGTVYYRIVFTPMFNPFNLERKRLLYTGSTYHKYRFIVDVKPVESRPVRCIHVEHESHLFLCGEQFIPTHNTVFAINHIVMQALECRNNRPQFAYICPTYKQAKMVAWDYIKEFTRDIVGVSYNEAELSCTFHGKKIMLLGADRNVDTLRGIYLDGVVLDEFAAMKPEAWEKVIRPTLSDRKGWAIFIGTPNGRDHLYDIYELSKTKEDWFSAIYPASVTNVLDQEELDSARELNETAYLQEYECRFDVVQGNVFKAEWLNYYRQLPHVKRYVWSWDTAIKKGEENDYSVGGLWAVCDNGYYLVDLVREKLEYPELKKKVHMCYNAHKSSEVIIEDKASGQQLLQELKRNTTMPVVAETPRNDKIERANLVSPLFESGRVFLPENAPWLRSYVDEITLFPFADHDDTVDMTTQFLRRAENKVKIRVRQL
jgi:predicted phage terminase large subunit-like protein